MIEKICSRCLESKPIDQYAIRESRCRPCKTESIELNRKHKIESAAEAAANNSFNAMMDKWVPSRLWINQGE